MLPSYTTNSANGHQDLEDSLIVYHDYTTVDQIPAMNPPTKKWNSVSKKRNSVTSLASTAVSSRLSSINTNSTGTSRENIWSTMTRRGYMVKSKDAYEDVDTELEFKEHTWKDTITAFVHGCIFEVSHWLRTLYSHPRIPIYSLLVFALLTCGALVIIDVICQNMQQKIEFDASLQALQTASWFADMFAKTLIPLRSLQQAIVHSNTFKDLPHKIGNRGEEGSAPSIFGPKSTSLKDYRNITGICDDQELIQEFQSIVKNINRNFGFEDIIITYRLAPYGVYCLADPMTVEFAADVSLNSAVDMGWDPIHSLDTKMSNLLRSIYHEENSIVLFGPDPSFLGIPGINIVCDHLAVEMPGYNYTLDGEERSIWGFVMSFIDWSKLKARSGIDEYYREMEYSYQLTRTDQVTDKETGEVSYKVRVITSSCFCCHVLF